MNQSGQAVGRGAHRLPSWTICRPVIGSASTRHSTSAGDASASNATTLIEIGLIEIGLIEIGR